MNRRDRIRQKIYGVTGSRQWGSVCVALALALSLIAVFFRYLRD